MNLQTVLNELLITSHLAAGKETQRRWRADGRRVLGEHLERSTLIVRASSLTSSAPSAAPDSGCFLVGAILIQPGWSPQSTETGINGRLLTIPLMHNWHGFYARRFVSHWHDPALAGLQLEVQQLCIFLMLFALKLPSQFRRAARCQLVRPTRRSSPSAIRFGRHAQCTQATTGLHGTPP